MDEMLEMMNDVPGLDIDRIDWYLVGKQGLRPDDLHYIPDVWAFTRKLHTRFALTVNEMWPRNLIAEHDRLSNLLAVAADKETEANFARVLDELGALELRTAICASGCPVGCRIWWRNPTSSCIA
jgi:hypothetical protein